MLRLRPTAPEDLDELTLWEGRPGTVEWLAETGLAWHARALADPDQEHVVALDSDTPVGFAVLAGLSSGESVELRRMAVSPEHRGAGRGRALLRAVLERSYRHHGARSVWLDVKTHNHRARALYESEGFLQQRTLRNALVEPDGTASDLVIMVHRPR